MTPTEIEGLVSRLRWYVTNVSSINSPLVPALQKIIAEAADALSQTIPRTTDEGMRVILAEECHRLGDVDGAANILAKAEPDFPVWSYAALAAMRRVSKTDEGMREILAQEMEARGESYKAQNIMAAPHSSIIEDTPLIRACLAAMRRVSKTDEGRNAVIEECARAAHAKRSECDEAFYETNGSIYTEAYLDGISAAYDAIRALTTGGK